MKDYEYEEENLDDFMVNAATILSEENNPEKNTIIESLKHHLSTIFHVQNEMENFFRTLNGVIFTSKSSNNFQKIDNKQPFILYPIIFSFNPRTTSYFLDYFLTSLQQSMCEENRPDFTFLSEVFADVIKAIFSDEKNNTNLIQKNYLLEQNKKKNIYEKLFNFCNNKIKTNKRLEQSFGCLLLTEFIEKCPLVKEDKYLDKIFKILSDYLEDRWFECKLDLLNCTISLIFSAEDKFKPYANTCLFRIIDYLTDIDWMKRKLAINIVYTLVFYCKDEVMAVKENIHEFLNTLKEDENEEVREVCLQTLKLLGEDDGVDGTAEGADPTEKNAEVNASKNAYNILNNKNASQINKANRIKQLGKSGDSNPLSNFRYDEAQNNIKSKQNVDNIRRKLEKEQEFLDKMERDFSENKNNSDDNNIGNNNKSKNIGIKSNSANNTIDESDKKKQNINKIKPLENSSPESMLSTINSIFEQLKKIQEDQAEFRQILADIKKTSANNYSSLSQRLHTLEKSFKYNRSTYAQYNAQYNYIEEHYVPKSHRDFRDKQTGKTKVFLSRTDEIKIEELKKRFNDGEYNEALISANNDRYLLKLIPLIDKKIVLKIEIAILENIISRLNKRLNILCMEGDRESINDVLLFYIQLLKSKKDFKLVTQLSIRDALNFLKVKGSNKLKEEDFDNIEAILESLKV